MAAAPEPTPPSPNDHVVETADQASNGDAEKDTGRPTTPVAGTTSPDTCGGDASYTPACTAAFVPPAGIAVQTASASPAPSIARCRSITYAPGAETSTTGENVPPAGRVDAWSAGLPIVVIRLHATTASPAGSMATCGCADGPPGVPPDTSAGAVKLPPADRVAAWISSGEPGGPGFSRAQATTASPAPPTATWGECTFLPSPDTDTPPSKPWPRGWEAARISQTVPFSARQTARPSPRPSTATCGVSAIPPGAETSSGSENAPPGARTEAWMTAPGV